MKGIPEGIEIYPVTPINGQILVYLEPEADKFSSAPSLVKPDAVKSDHVFRLGRVIKKGPGIWNKKNTARIPIDVEVGARVMFIKFLATGTRTAESIQHTLGKDFTFLQAKDIILEVDEDFKIEDVSQ
jgi:co-chaperonin GroES (HSP10)